jgi:hypothetical protein
VAPYGNTNQGLNPIDRALLEEVEGKAEEAEGDRNFYIA